MGQLGHGRGLRAGLYSRPGGSFAPQPCRGLWTLQQRSPVTQSASQQWCAFCVLALQIQLIRIHMRVPEYGWTTQKVFHLLNCMVCAVRVGIFVFRTQVENLTPAFAKLLILDLPGELPTALQATCCTARA